MNLKNTFLAGILSATVSVFSGCSGLKNGSRVNLTGNQIFPARFDNEQYVKNIKILPGGERISDHEIDEIRNKILYISSNSFGCESQIEQLSESFTGIKYKLKYMIIDDIIFLKEEFLKIKEKKQKLDKNFLKQGFDLLIEKIGLYIIISGEIDNSKLKMLQYLEKQVFENINHELNEKFDSFGKFIYPITSLLQEIGGFEMLDLYSSEDNIDISSFNSNDLDRTFLMNKLNSYGETQYIELSNVKGPVLVIFPEVHEHEKILYDHYQAIRNTKDYYNYIATEGENQEMIHDSVEMKEKIGKFSKIIEKGDISEEDFKRMVDSGIGISSIFLEAFFKDKIQTFGVEDVTFGDDSPYEYISVNDKYIIEFRNYIWLRYIKSILKNVVGNKKGKNFIPLICGEDHVNNLIEQASKMGFKGVIIFKSNYSLNFGSIDSIETLKEQVDLLEKSTRRYNNGVCSEVQKALEKQKSEEQNEFF